MFIVDVPAIRVKVVPKFLGLDENLPLEEGYLVAVTSIPSRPLFFTVHLESGAVWQRLPINAIKCDRFNSIPEPDNRTDYETETVQPFSCLEGSISAIEYKHLKNYEVLFKPCNDGKIICRGNYLFTIDVIGPGLSEDPVQHKAHNIIVDEEGQLWALPNNWILFKDKYFTLDKEVKYKRVDKYYLAGG